MLWVGDVAIDTTWIYALNNKWETMVTGNQNYYPVKSQKLNSTIFIPLKEVNEIGEILNKKEYWTKYQYTRPFNIDLDNFILHAKIKGDSVNFENLCPDQKIRLVGDQHQKILLHFVNKGCQEYQRSEISEKELHGNQAEYPTFEQNLRHWNVIRYKVKNKKVMLTVNDTSSFSTIYTEPAGKLYTISITSRGQSKIDYIGLFTLNHDTIYWEDFE